MVIWNYRYRVFGDPPSRRSAEDIAFSVARFFSKNGSLVNYYMVTNNLIMLPNFFYEINLWKLCFLLNSIRNWCSTMVEQILVEQALPSLQPDITMKPLLMSTVCRENQNGVTWGMCTGHWAYARGPCLMVRLRSQKWANITR